MLNNKKHHKYSIYMTLCYTYLDDMQHRIHIVVNIIYNDIQSVMHQLVHFINGTKTYILYLV